MSGQPDLASGHDLRWWAEAHPTLLRHDPIAGSPRIATRCERPGSTAPSVSVARLRGDDVAQGIQLYMAYEPEPPFDAGSPERAPAAVTARMRAGAAPLTARVEAAQPAG